MTTPEPTPSRDGVRQVDLLRMPLRRKREIAVGLLRGKLRTRDLGLGHSPIIHGGVDIRMAHGVIEFGRFCEIHRRVVLAVGSGIADRPARLTIGDRTSIWYGTVVSARTEITIGANCAISWNCSIMDNDMHRILDADGGFAGGGLHELNEDREHVRIGDHVWVGAAAIILKGVTIGSNSVVAAGAVVTRDVPANTLVAGVPARPVRHIGGWR